MVCLETETDRTLFFDLLPLDVGVIGGFKTRLQLYTVPGQVFYNTTRKLVLKGVDGIVFVADSQRPMRDPNVESLRNLRENLAEIGLTLESVPLVLQYNKRDLQNILSIDELNESLNADRAVEWYEASATNGTGVFETLKAISKLTLRSLKGRMSVEQRRPTVVVSGETPRRSRPPRFTPRHPGAHVSGITAAVDSLGAPESAGAPPASAARNALRLDDLPPAAPAVPPSPGRRPPRRERVRDQPRGADAAAGHAAARVAEAPPPEAPFEAANLPPAEDPAAEVSFAEIQPPPDEPPPDSSVKHVRVRSNVDILSELEKLRKIATQKPASPPSVKVRAPPTSRSTTSSAPRATTRRTSRRASRSSCRARRSRRAGA